MTVWALYSEIDPFAAAWLQHLIGAGHIMPGVVDTRSLEDLTPDECREFTQVHLCAGIGVWSYALRMAGWDDNRPCWTASFPCQPFSAAGKGAGFADERHIWPAGYWLIDQCRPAKVFGEQVASKDGLAWLDVVSADLERSGYAFGAVDLCAAGVGAPHIRQRSYWVADTTAIGSPAGSRDASVSNGEQQSQRPSRIIGLGDDDDTRLEGLDRHGDYGGEPRRLDAKPAGSGRTASGVGGLADSDGRDARTKWQSTSGQHGQQPQDCGFAGPWKSYADWFGVCWHPVCRDSDESHCWCNDLGAPNGWAWDDDEGWMGNASGQPCERDARAVLGTEAGEHGARLAVDGPMPVRSEHASAGVGGGQPGPTNGFWRDADWLFCRDGKWRPVEPGTFPLAHGATNRVGRLRGYGNAIVAPVAEAFIRAVMA